MVYQRIQYFLKAAEEGSFSKAAEKMYVSSQGLTRQIRLLEEELGGRLFERSPRGVKLTPLGEKAYHGYSGIDQNLRRVNEELKLWVSENRKQINIGIFSALPQEKVVMPMIMFWTASFPDYQINLSMVELADGRTLMAQGKIDLLLTNIHEEEDWRPYRCLRLDETKTQVVVSLYHPWVVKKEITKEDMAQETFLKMDMSNAKYNVPLKENFYENIPCKQIEEVDNFRTLLTLLQRGDSFAVFPKMYEHMDEEKVKYFDFPGRQLTYYVMMIYNPERSGGELDGIVRETVDEFNMKEMKL